MFSNRVVRNSVVSQSTLKVPRAAEFTRPSLLLSKVFVRFKLGLRRFHRATHWYFTMCQLHSIVCASLFTRSVHNSVLMCCISVKTKRGFLSHQLRHRCSSRSECLRFSDQREKKEQEEFCCERYKTNGRYIDWASIAAQLWNNVEVLCDAFFDCF